MINVMWRSFVLESGGAVEDYVSATTCCLVLQRLLASRPCFESVKSMPEVVTVLFQVFFLQGGKVSFIVLLRTYCQQISPLCCNEQFRGCLWLTSLDHL